MIGFPFQERRISEKQFLREFTKDTSPGELVWHQDREDRVIKVVEANGWKLQLDNQLPVLLENNSTYHIPAYLYHRVIKGSGKLVIKVEKKT